MTEPEHTLMAYADGELDSAAAQEVERRLAGDAGARAMVAMYRRTSALLRQSCDTRFYPGGDSIRLPAPAAPLDRLRRHGWALAASVALALSGFAGGLAWDAARGTDVLEEVAEYHKVFSRETRHLVELRGEQLADLAAWVGEPAGRGLTVPDLSAAGLHVAGGRLLVIDGERVAEVMYTRERGLPVGLCISRADKPGAQRITLATRGDLRLASWRTGELSFVVVGELDPDAARDVAARIAAQTGA